MYHVSYIIYTQVPVTILASREYMAKNETPEKHRAVLCGLMALFFVE